MNNILQFPPLYEHLAAFVPLEIREWQKQGGPEEWHFEEAQRRMRRLQENPDSDSSILFPGHKKGLASLSIAMLVECLGVMAFVPGGVKFGPLHFEAMKIAMDAEEKRAEELNISLEDETNNE